MYFRVQLADIDYPFVFCILMLLGETIGGSFNCFVVHNVNKANQEAQIMRESNIKKEALEMNAIRSAFHSIKYKPLKTKQANKFLCYMTILGLALIECVSTTVYFGISNEYNDIAVISEFNLKSIQILITVILCSRLVFHYPLYIHQYVSMALITIGMIFATSCTIYIDYLWIVVLFWFCYFFLWSIKEVIEKVLMERYSFSPLYLILIEGTIGLCIILLLTTLSYFFCNDTILGIKTSIAIWSIHPTAADIGYMVGYLVGNIGLYVCLITTNKLFTPISRSVADSFSVILWKIISIISNTPLEIEEQLIVPGLGYVGYSLIALGCLLFNEVVILYFCNLHDNTKKEIIMRGNNELEGMDEMDLIVEEVDDNVLE